MSNHVKKAAAGPRGLRNLFAKLRGSTVKNAQSDLDALRRVSEIAEHPDVPKLLRRDLRNARSAVEHAKNQQFDSRAGAALGAGVVATGAGTGLAEYYRRQRNRDLERFYGVEKQAAIGASIKRLTKNVVEGPNNVWNHANGRKINTYLDKDLGLDKKTRKGLMGKPYEQIASEVTKSIPERDHRRVLRDLGKLNAKRRAAKMGILGLGAGSVGTHYKLQANRAKKEKNALDKYLSEEPAQPDPGYRLVATQNHFNRG